MNASALLSEMSQYKLIGVCCVAIRAIGILSALAQLRIISAVAQSAPVALLLRLAWPEIIAPLVFLFLAGRQRLLAIF